MARRALTAAKKYAAEIVICLLVLATAVGFYEQRNYSTQRAHDRTAEIRDVCRAGNDAKDAIRKTLDTIIGLSPPLTAEQRQQVDALNRALRPVLTHKDCTTLR